MKRNDVRNDRKKKKKDNSRERNQSNIIYGKNPVYEALENGTSVLRVFTCDPKISAELSKKRIDVTLIPKEKFFDIYGENSQSIAAQIKDYDYTDLDDFLEENKDSSLVLVLDHIEDTGNLGAIIRSAEVFGVDMVVIPDKRAAEINATVWKTSAGAVNNVRVCKVSNLNSAIARLKENGYWVYGAEAHSEKNLYDLDIDIKTVVVIGSEGNGISRLVKENLDFGFYIPMYGKINSLNASVACGVSLSEIKRKIEIAKEKK